MTSLTITLLAVGWVASCVLANYLLIKRDSLNLVQLILSVILSPVTWLVIWQRKPKKDE